MVPPGHRQTVCDGQPVPVHLEVCGVTDRHNPTLTTGHSEGKVTPNSTQKTGTLKSMQDLHTIWETWLDIFRHRHSSHTLQLTCANEKTTKLNYYFLEFSRRFLIRDTLTDFGYGSIAGLQTVGLLLGLYQCWINQRLLLTRLSERENNLI